MRVSEARDGSKPSLAAIDAVTRRQAAIDAEYYPNADCSDVVTRILASVR